MDFAPSPAEEAFRRAVRRWLRENLPTVVGAGERSRSDDPAERLAVARRWQRRLYEGGWAGLSWPREYGGRGATPTEQLAFAEEYVAAGAPPLIDIGVGLSLTGPTLIHHGTEAQKRRFLPAILRGDEVWCQGFSEPNAGSDLAAVRTRAERRGDRWAIRGQKIWTSYARFADWCLLLARTATGPRKHEGLTMFLVDMRSPGITVRPLVEMTGVAWFNEVFFDDVPVADDGVVGRPGDGWTIATGTLAHERYGAAPHARLAAEWQAVAALARRRRRDGATAASVDPRWRQELAGTFIDIAIARLVAWKQASAAGRGSVAGPEGSCFKLLWSEADQRLTDLAIALEGPYAQLDRDDPRACDAGRWQYEWLWSRAATLYAGTSEVQRNILAQRMLGLPRG